jgi:hypothetical protein
MIEIPQFLKNAADKCGFLRETFNEANIPTNASNICVLPFFGDLRTSFVLSSLLLRPYRQQAKGSKYFILCSWPGHKMLYPFVDEYWSIKDFSHIGEFYACSNNFSNDEADTVYIRQLNRFFDEVIFPQNLETFYSGGLKNYFFTVFPKIERHFPMIPSAGLLGNNFNRTLAKHPGPKILLYPSIVVKSWRKQTENIRTKKEFWVQLAERLLKEGYTPVVVHNYATHDISNVLAQKCVYVSDNDLEKITCAMRVVGCVLDVFSDLSRLAVIARSPFLAVTERDKYMGLREFELDDLCAFDLPRQYIFSFSTILGQEPIHWGVNLFDNIIHRINSFLPSINKDGLPPASALTEEVSYEKVRKKKLKKFGTKFIKLERD